MVHGQRRKKILEVIANFFKRSQFKEDHPLARDRDVRRAAVKVIRKYKKDLKELGKY